MHTTMICGWDGVPTHSYTGLDQCPQIQGGWVLRLCGRNLTDVSANTPIGPQGRQAGGEEEARRQAGGEEVGGDDRRKAGRRRRGRRAIVNWRRCAAVEHHRTAGAARWERWSCSTARFVLLSGGRENSSLGSSRGRRGPFPTTVWNFPPIIPRPVLGLIGGKFHVLF